MTKKFELTDEKNEYGLRRVRYLIDLPDVDIKAGDMGGWIEKEENLSQGGNASIGDDARIGGNARIWGNASIGDDARIWGNASIGGNASVKSDVDWMAIGPIGSRDGMTTIYRTETGLEVVCGCFTGSLDKFLARVERTHGDNQHGRAYRAMVEMVKARML